MTARLIGETGSTKRRRFLLLPTLLVACTAIFWIAGAQSAPYTGGVQNTGLFELDANTLDISCDLPADWAALYTAGGLEPCSSDGWAFIPDGVGDADRTYWSQGGSKDAYDPALGPWLWKPNDVSPDKNDIVNAFAAAYHIDSGDDTHRFLFFGADRFNTSGDAQLGFQFLQADTCLAGSIGGVDPGGTAACPASTPNQVANAGKFVDPTTGEPVHHRDGDVLVLVNFNNGGVLGQAGVFVWGGADGAGAGSYSQVLFGDGANCLTIGDPNNFCSTSNTGNLAGEPVWAYTAKNQKGQPVTTYTPSAFIEGGLNLGAIAGAGSCFPSFLAETRSAAGPSSGLSLQAQLKDLAFGKFELCDATLVTTPKDGSGGSIPAEGLSIGGGSVTARDSAQLDVSGANEWSGTLDFYLCGPGVTTCSDAGVHIGSTINVNEDTVMPVVSDAATITSAGTYCWAGVFDSATAGVPDRTDATAGECFTVTKVTPVLDTVAVLNANGDPIPPGHKTPFGSAVFDTATLSGAATEPGSGGPNPTYPTINPTVGGAYAGTIAFELKGPDGETTNCSTTATGTGTNPQTVNVDTLVGNKTYGPVSFTPNSPGVFHWIATYTNSGSANNNSPVTHNSACDDLDENVAIEQIPTEIKTKQSWYPNDTATVSADSGNLGAAGSVEFSLYTTANCSGNAVYTETKAINGGSPTEEVGTNNQTYKITTGYGDAADSLVGVHSWKVVYTPAAADTAHTGTQSACNAEHFDITYTNDPGPS